MPSDKVVGYVIADVVAGCQHVEQVSVHPVHQGEGLGRALLEEVQRWADGEGLLGVTLTTFKDVAWNRPLYEHLGFKVLAESELSRNYARSGMPRRRGGSIRRTGYACERNSGRKERAGANDRAGFRLRAHSRTRSG